VEWNWRQIQILLSAIAILLIVIMGLVSMLMLFGAIEGMLFAWGIGIGLGLGLVLLNKKVWNAAEKLTGALASNFHAPKVDTLVKLTLVVFVVVVVAFLVLVGVDDNFTLVFTTISGFLSTIVAFYFTKDDDPSSG
jgi:hypothetical protein